MHKIYRFLWIWVALLGFVMASESFIVLSYGDKDSVLKEQNNYHLFVKNSADLQVKSKIKNVSDKYMLQVGPYDRDDVLALAFMRLKERFPSAVIIEKQETLSEVKTEVKPVEKKVFIEKKVFVEKTDETLWIALFGLAIVGILFMFLSSDQIKRMKEEHEKIKSKHKRLEEKQHEVLSSMGENIHAIATEAMSHTSNLSVKVKDTRLHKEMEEVVHNEHELLDVTEDLIKFLRLKSKKVVIQNEVFNFNHVLNEVAGLLSQSYKQNDMEIIYDIDKEVAKYMWADSLHMGQILSNILEYMIQYTHNKEMKVSVTQYTSLTEGKQLRFVLTTHLHVSDKSHLFDSYYDEVTRKYEGLGLFVANELTQLMDGELNLLDGEDGYQYFELIIPIEEKNKDKRKYRLPDKGLVGKKILIVDKSDAAARATEKLFSYFRAEVKVLSVDVFNTVMPNFSQYDIVALSDTLFNFKRLEALKKVKEMQTLKIISLDNLFSSQNIVPNNAIDICLVKPLTQEYVFDTLIELYAQKEKNNIHHKSSFPNTGIKLPIYREFSEDSLHITLESFRIFKGAHILIVEDNIINQKVVLSVLGKSGMTLSVANNGEDAVAFMHNHVGKIDFIFMDINMPVMDGFRASELIRNDNRYDAVPIVALTALVSEHEKEKMFDSGMNGYLSKPVRIEKLYTALELFLTQHRDNEEKINNEKKSIVIQLDGLDIEKGLAHMKNNDIFYKEVLKEFKDAYAQSDQVFEKLVKEQRYMQLKMLCIDMKGLTGTIGAKEMQGVINEIHQHMLYNKLELLHSAVKPYREELKKLIVSINLYLEEV